MKKFVVSFVIFVFVSLSFSNLSFAYDVRQLPWKLPEKPEDYRDSHKYIMIYEAIPREGAQREVYLYYCHVPFSAQEIYIGYTLYRYRQPETIVYKLIQGVFVFQGITDGFVEFRAYYLEENGNNQWLYYDEWMPNRDRIAFGFYPIASNVNIKFGDKEWDKSNGLYDLPLPDAIDDDIDEEGLVGGIVGGLLNGLKSLFIPEKNIFQDIVNKFADKFPIVGQVVDLFSNLYNIGDNEPVFKITYNDMELKIVDFSSFEAYLPLIRNLTGAFLFLSFISREIKILPRIIRGRH